MSEADAAAGRTGVARPVNLQSGYRLLEPAADALTAVTRDGLSFTAYSPLAGGWLAGRHRAGEPYPRDSRMALRPDPYAHLVNDATFAALDALRQRATDRGVALPALALAWVLSDPAVSVVVVGPRRPDQLAPALAALDLGGRSATNASARARDWEPAVTSSQPSITAKPAARFRAIRPEGFPSALSCRQLSAIRA